MSSRSIRRKEIARRKCNKRKANLKHTLQIFDFDHLCYLCLVFVMLLRLFIAALWSPAGKGLVSWLLFVMFNCIFVIFPCDILGQVGYLIVSIPDLCCLSNFEHLPRLKIHTVNKCLH